MKSSLAGIIVTGLALGTAWAVRGQFGHEQGAAWAGAIGAMVLVMASRRPGWYRKILTVSLSSAVGWGAGGMISYGLVVGYGRSDDFANAAYGLVMLFVIGGLFGLLGGGLTGLSLENTENKKVKWGCLMAEMTAGGIVTWYLLVSQLEILMTPPRSEAWAVCLGAGLAMLWHMARNGFKASMRVALITALGGGFGFASGNFLQVCGNLLEINFNMWNVMEYSIGFFGGTSLAFAVFTSAWPEESSAPAKWENNAALFFLFIFIPLIIFSQSFSAGKLSEKFSSSTDPENIALLSSIAAAIVFIVSAIIASIALIRSGKSISPKNGLLFTLTSLAVYIIASYIVSGALAGTFMLNHHLYVVNYAVILMLLGRNDTPAFSQPLEELNGRKWLLSVISAIIIILLLALFLVSIHGDLPGAQKRF